MENGHGWSVLRYGSTFVNKLWTLVLPYKAKVNITLDSGFNFSKNANFFHLSSGTREITIHKNGMVLDDWLRENLKGKVRYVTVRDHYVDMHSLSTVTEDWTVELDFSDPREAAYFKLIWA
jgi:hypothetical protein